MEKILLHLIGIDIPFEAEFDPSMSAYIAAARKYLLVAFETTDEEFLTRRPGPMMVKSAAGFADKSNGPQKPHGNNHLLCDGYPCNSTVATYHAVCAVGEFQLRNSRIHCRK